MNVQALTVNPKGHRLLPWLAYPGVLLIGMVCYRLLGSLGMGLQVASYLSATLAGMLIVLLEHYSPHYVE